MTTNSPTWHLQPGDTIRRVELHERYGGSTRNGICTCVPSNNILLFSDPDKGRKFGYIDGWAEDGTFHYSGEGQKNNQQFTRGNKAIRDHKPAGGPLVPLRLFDGTSTPTIVRYVGEFVINSEDPFHISRGPDRTGAERDIIRFHLVRAERSAPPLAPDLSVGGVYRPVDDTVQPVLAPLATPNTDLAARNLTAHRRLQNNLAHAVTSAGLIPLSPRLEDPDFDLAWRRSDGQLIVCEVKSLTDDNEARQLRMGIGQVLDYLSQVATREPNCLGVLWTEREPSHPRWAQICRDVGLYLAWPGEEHQIIA